MPNDSFSNATDTLDLSGRMARNPYPLVLIAAGVGFIASGALFSRFTMRAINLGVRIAALPILEQQLQAMTRFNGQERNTAGSSDPRDLHAHAPQTRRDRHDD